MTILSYILHFTWGILQNLYSLVFFIFYLKNKHYVYHGAIVTEWNKNYSQGIGCFIFINKNENEKTLVHEYGHTIQSLILGPLFLPIIAIPSGIWCFSKSLIKYRNNKQISYFDFYTEKWANILGEKATNESSTH